MPSFEPEAAPERKKRDESVFATVSNIATLRAELAVLNVRLALREQGDRTQKALKGVSAEFSAVPSRLAAGAQSAAAQRAEAAQQSLQSAVIEAKAVPGRLAEGVRSAAAKQAEMTQQAVRQAAAEMKAAPVRLVDGVRTATVKQLSNARATASQHFDSAHQAVRGAAAEAQAMPFTMMDQARNITSEHAAEAKSAAAQAISSQPLLAFLTLDRRGDGLDSVRDFITQFLRDREGPKQQFVSYVEARLAGLRKRAKTVKAWLLVIKEEFNL